MSEQHHRPAGASPGAAPATAAPATAEAEPGGGQQEAQVEEQPGERSSEQVGTDGADLRRLATTITGPDRAAAAAAEERLALLGARHGGLGRLGTLAAWLASVRGPQPERPLERVRLVVLAGDHGMARVGLSQHPAGWTGAQVRALHDGTAPAAVLARELGAGVRVVDVGVDEDLADLPAQVGRYKVRRGSADARHEDALTREEAEAAFRAGVAIVDEEVDGGADLLLLGGAALGSTAAAAALVGACLRSGPVEVLGRELGDLDDATWMRRTAAVRDALRRGRVVAHDPMRLLVTIGGADAAAATGFLLQAAVRRTPVLLDGLAPTAAALVAVRTSLTAKQWWQVGPRAPEPAHDLALKRLGHQPLVELGLGCTCGVGALTALPVLRAAHALLGAAARA